MDFIFKIFPQRIANAIHFTKSLTLHFTRILFVFHATAKAFAIHFIVLRSKYAFRLFQAKTTTVKIHSCKQDKAREQRPVASRPFYLFWKLVINTYDNR